MENKTLFEKVISSQMLYGEYRTYGIVVIFQKTGKMPEMEIKLLSHNDFINNYEDKQIIDFEIKNGYIIPIYNVDENKNEG